MCLPILTPTKEHPRQNGKRYRENGEEMYTLTGQDRHGVIIGVEPLGGVYCGKSADYQRGVLLDVSRCLDTNGRNGVALKIDMGEADMDEQEAVFRIKNGTKRGYLDADLGDSVNLAFPESKFRRGRVGKQIANTLDTSCNQGVVVKVDDDLSVYAVWFEEYQNYVTIRKLTPKECFRLQGWTDDYFERAQLVNSDSQQYKQAGNGVTVNVIQAIAERMSLL